MPLDLPPIYHNVQVGESYTPTDCSTKCTCESAGADLTCVDMTCSDNYVCGTSNGVPACVCEAPFVLDGAKCVGQCLPQFMILILQI